MRVTEFSEVRTSYDPARRFKAHVKAAHAAGLAGESYDLFEAMVESVLGAHGSALAAPLPDDASDKQRAAADIDLIEGIQRGVRAAVATYDIPSARNLFEACLLAGASSEDLEREFAVSAYETAAFSHLFFDRTVFPNAFHVVSYIASQSKDDQDLLRIAQAQGFDAIATQYGSAREVTPEAALANVLAADAANYRRYRELPITDQTTKEVRALGKQVVATATAMQKVHDAKSVTMQRSKAAREGDDFVIVPGPANPTLLELLDAGGRIAVTPVADDAPKT